MTVEIETYYAEVEGPNQIMYRLVPNLIIKYVKTIGMSTRDFFDKSYVQLIVLISLSSFILKQS